MRTLMTPNWVATDAMNLVVPLFFMGAKPSISSLLLDWVPKVGFALNGVSTQLLVSVVVPPRHLLPSRAASRFLYACNQAPQLKTLNLQESTLPMLQPVKPHLAVYMWAVLQAVLAASDHSMLKPSVMNGEGICASACNIARDL